MLSTSIQSGEDSGVWARVDKTVAATVGSQEIKQKQVQTWWNDSAGACAIVTVCYATCWWQPACFERWSAMLERVQTRCSSSCIGRRRRSSCSELAVRQSAEPPLRCHICGILYRYAMNFWNAFSLTDDSLLVLPSVRRKCWRSRITTIPHNGAPQIDNASC